MSGRILLVEDEELVGTMVKMNLESAGYQVLWIKNGEEALGSLDNQDVILLDITLPGMDGIQVLSELRKNGHSTPVMMLTARTDVQTKVQTLEIGADDYLPKPFDVAEMIARVNALVRRSREQPNRKD